MIKCSVCCAVCSITCCCPISCMLSVALRAGVTALGLVVVSCSRCHRCTVDALAATLCMVFSHGKREIRQVDVVSGDRFYQRDILHTRVERACQSSQKAVGQIRREPSAAGNNVAAADLLTVFGPDDVHPQKQPETRHLLSQECKLQTG